MTDTGPFRGNKFDLELGGDYGMITGLEEIQIPNHVTARSSFSGNDPEEGRQMWSVTQYDDLVVKRSVDQDNTFFEWREKVEQGQVKDARLDSISVILRSVDRDGSNNLRWNFTNAWPKEYHTPNFNARANEVAYETLVIAHEGMTREAEGEEA